MLGRYDGIYFNSEGIQYFLKYQKVCSNFDRMGRMDSVTNQFIKEQHTVRTEDGYESQMSLFRQSEETRKPVLVCMPAMGVTASHYEILAQAIAQKGLNVVITELRGIGTSSYRASRQNNFGYHEMITYDWPAIVEAVKTRFPQSQIYFLGHSLGGQISALYQSVNPDADIKGLVTVACCSVYFQGWKFPQNMVILFLTQLARWLSFAWGYFPGKQIGFGGKEARGVMKDWAFQARTGKYKILGSPFDFEELLTQVQIPILAISLDRDTFAPKKAVEHLYKKMSQAEVSHIHLTKNEADEKSLNHFSWLKTPEYVVSSIEKWIESHYKIQ